MDLHQAIIKGDFLLTRRLVEAGADVNVIDNERRTPLMVCCLHDGESRALAVARILLMHGALVGLCDGQGRNALMYSVLYERLGITKLFLEALDYDLNYTDREGCTALLYAAKVGNSSITKMLLKSMKRYGLEVDKPDKEGVTPLILSCRLGHKQCAADLRSLGKASECIKDKVHGKTAKDWEL
uniref:Uncharacterized protein n=1 Tax=Lepisosteus oculatus TaxID=7918 RepID=W5NNE8_LEPOC